MTREVDPRHVHSWPDVRALIRSELESYVLHACDDAIRALPTRCEPWTVDDVTKHLAQTFRRYAALLQQARAGDFTPPFALDGLAEENRRAVDAFDGDPIDALVEAVNAFVDGVGDDLNELTAHQVGPVPVGQQLLWGLNELAVHHDDVLRAAGGVYRPPAGTIEALILLRERLEGELPRAGDEPWQWLLAGTGR